MHIIFVVFGEFIGLLNGDTQRAEYDRLYKHKSIVLSNIHFLVESKPKNTHKLKSTKKKKKIKSNNNRPTRYELSVRAYISTQIRFTNAIGTTTQK